MLAVVCRYLPVGVGITYSPYIAAGGYYSGL